MTIFFFPHYDGLYENQDDCDDEEVLTENVRIELPMGKVGLAVTQPAGGSNTTQHSTLLNTTQTLLKHYSNTTQTQLNTTQPNTQTGLLFFYF